MSATTTTLPQTGTWSIDTSHSSAEFVVRHLVVSKVKGRFTTFDGKIEIDGNDPLASSVTATIELASVDTHDEKRDEHLRSADFFDVENHPTMTFVSRKVVPDGGDDYKVEGDLSIRGVTRPVVLDLEFNGQSADPWGGTRAGFSATTEINRRDFGLEWNMVVDSGAALVGEKVKIALEIEAVLA
jgi:polyisoprenoid-binding protein YceI